MAPTNAHARVFFALPVDGALAGPLAKLARHTAAASGGRAVAATNLHATVAFIGDVARAAIDTLRAIGDELDADALDVALDAVGSFRAARVAWIGPSQTPQPLTVLHAALTARLAAASFEVDTRPYHPHITLARHCRRAIPLAPVEPLAWGIGRLVLYESIMARAGPRYEELGAWRLTPRR